MSNTLSDFLENSFLNLAFGATSYTPSGTLYVGLSTSTMNDDGTGLTEVTGLGYERVPITNDKTTWTVSTTGGLSNAIAFTFPQASSNWGTVTDAFIIDHAVTGNFYCQGALGTSKLISNEDTAQFPIGSFVITLD